MRTANLRSVKEKLTHYVSKAQKDYLLITKHGRPSALLVGVEGRDMEDIFYMTNPQFWKMIRKRRNQKTVPWSLTKHRPLPQ